MSDDVSIKQSQLIPSEINQPSEREYLLTGRTGWDIYDEDFRGVVLRKKFKAVNDDTAMEKAKELIRIFLADNREYSPIEDGAEYNASRPTFKFSLEAVIWEVRFKPKEEAVPAKPAKLDRFEETIFVSKDED